MAYPNGGVKLVVSGSLYDIQSWSIGVELVMSDFGGIMPQDTLQTWLEDDATPAIATWMTAISTIRSEKCTWSNTRASVYAAPAGIVAAAEAPAGTYTAGSQSGNQNPRTALVVSKMTGIPLRSARGRMYVPALGCTPVTSTGRVQASDRTTLGNATKALYNALAATTLQEQTLEPAVLSPTTGIAYPIRSLRIDDLFDTQRRREDKFQPAYSTFDL